MQRVFGFSTSLLSDTLAQEDSSIDLLVTGVRFPSERNAKSVRLRVGKLNCSPIDLSRPLEVPRSGVHFNLVNFELNPGIENFIRLVSFLTMTHW